MTIRPALPWRCVSFTMFGKKVEFALAPTMQPDLLRVQAFLERVRGEPFLLFGFTQIIWRYFLG